MHVSGLSRPLYRRQRLSLPRLAAVAADTFTPTARQFRYRLDDITHDYRYFLDNGFSDAAATIHAAR